MNAFGTCDETDRLRESGRVDPTPLVTNRVSLEEVPEMFVRWAADPTSVGKILVTVDGSFQ